MSRSSVRTGERGMVLLIAMFTLVLLSVVGLGLMYSTNMETFINANYRDKQVAMYGALSGVQEARDRLQPAAPQVYVPVDMPTLTNRQVIYIINPKAGETVAPWDLTNPYADTELCQEGILDLTPTPGVPCAELPMGTDWYTVIDNSDPSNAPWNLNTPTDTKWTRITLKGNAMTPVPVVNGAPAVDTQVCWQGAQQMLKPAGYATNCWPDGSLITVTVTAGGINYASAPTVTIDPPPTGGTQATATATIAPIPTGALQSIILGDPGAGYESAPTVEITGGGGMGATATATIVDPGSPVASVSLSDPGGQCYATPPSVSFSGGGSGATAIATLESTPSCIVSWTVTGACHARRGSTLAGVGLEGGSGFSGSITFKNGSGNVINTSIDNPGTGFTVNPTTLSDIGCGSLTVTAVVGYRLDDVTLASGGSGYSTVPNVGIASGTGAGVAPATATATIGAIVTGGTVSSVTLNNPGTGYTSAPVVTLVGGGLSVSTIATATASLATTNSVSEITITNAGLGYTSNPMVAIGGGGGTGAAATASRAYGYDYGRVFLVTSMAQTRSGAKAMAQAELASPVIGATFPAALTLNGPNPSPLGMPNSILYDIDGTDQNSCGDPVADVDRPAIGGFDNPDADPPTTSVDNILDAIPSGREGQYTGLGDDPSVMNVYNSLGETFRTPSGLKSFIDAVAGTTGAHVYGDDPSSIHLGSAANPGVVYVDGDLSLPGNPSGYGILVVTGALTMAGNFQWHGIILVVGDGVAQYQGGGNPSIEGTVFVAKIWDNHVDKNLLGELGTPQFDWNGGGGNGIHYDHCYVQNLIPMIPYTPPPSTVPLKIISTRTVTY